MSCVLRPAGWCSYAFVVLPFFAQQLCGDSKALNEFIAHVAVCPFSNLLYVLIVSSTSFLDTLWQVEDSYYQC